MPDNTIEQQDKTKAGQRRINMIWEFTQGIIAISITFARIYCSIKQIPSPEITTAFILVASLYLIRTNHHLVGGTGAKGINEQR